MNYKKLPLVIFNFLIHKMSWKRGSWISLKLNLLWSKLCQHLHHGFCHHYYYHYHKKSTIRSHQKNVLNVILIPLLIKFTRIYTLFWCYYCGLWTGKCPLRCDWNHSKDFHESFMKVFSKVNSANEYNVT